MANKHQAEGYEQDEHAWYREPVSCVEQLFDAIHFNPGMVWDMSCGAGNILDVAKRRGFDTVGSDIVARGARHPFYRQNFLTSTKWPTPRRGVLNIVNNPPFNVPPGAALSFIEKAIDTIPFDRAAFLLPIEFLAGQERYSRLFTKHPPSHVAICSQRPSMPPGKEVEALGDKAFKGGKADFCWIVLSAGGPYRTELVWLRPDAAPTKSDAPIRRAANRPRAK